VLVRGARGEDVSFTRVTADCAAGPPTPAQFRLTSDNGEWIARAMAPCRLPGLPYDGVVVDRGFLKASRGATAPPTGVVLPPPAQVVGELFPSKALSDGGLAHPAPLVLAAELETPAPPGIAPAPYAGGAANLEYVGAYAPTWFGLAGAAALVYAAMLWRRTHPKPTSPR
jgi:surfeit locus 1 family protein